jgi:hypothetical protein
MSQFEKPLNTGQAPAVTDSSLPHVEARRIELIVKTSIDFYRATPDPKRLLSDQELGRLAAPLAARIEAGLLDTTEGVSGCYPHIHGLISGIANGGLPVELFIKDPCKDLFPSSTAQINDGSWLPAHLQEQPTTLPLNEGDPSEFTVQQHRIISLAQRTLQEVNPALPVFFVGSAAAKANKPARDIDIGMSCALKATFSNPNDPIYRNDFDRFSFALRQKMFEGNQTRTCIIDTRPEHVGAVWGYMTLAVGVSVARHGQAFRISSDKVHIITAKPPATDGNS